MTRATAPRHASPPGGSFEISFDEPTATMLVTMDGFWTVADQARYVSASRARIDTLRSRGRWFAIMVDVTGMPVQSREVSEAFGRTLGEHRATAAIAAAGGMVKMQAKRIGSADHVGVFASRDEARTWIASRRSAAGQDRHGQLTRPGRSDD